MCTCDGAGLCYVKNDAPFPFDGRLTLNITAFGTGATSVALDEALALPAGAGAIHWFHSQPVASMDPRQHVLEAIVTNADGSTMSRNVVPFTTPEHMALAPARLSVTAARTTEVDGNVSFYADIKGSAVAM